MFCAESAGTHSVVLPEVEQTLLCTLCSVGVVIMSRDPLITATIPESTICGAVLADSLAEREMNNSLLHSLSCPHVAFTPLSVPLYE